MENPVEGLSPAVPDWGAVFAGAINTSMGGGGAPGIGSKQDQSIETLLAEFQAAPSISLGDFPTLDESFLRQTGTLALPFHWHCVVYAARHILRTLTSALQWLIKAGWSCA